MMMKFNFCGGPLTLKGKSSNRDTRINVELYGDDLSEEVIFEVAEKLYSDFDIDQVALHIDDTWICYIEKTDEDIEPEEGEE